MSLNSYANHARRAHLRERAELADWGLVGSSSYQETVALSRRQEEDFLVAQSGGKIMVDMVHLRRELARATKRLADAWWPRHGEAFGPLPENFLAWGHTPGAKHFWDRTSDDVRYWRRLKPVLGRGCYLLPPLAAEEVVFGHRQVTGFISAMAEMKLPALKKVLKKNPSPRQGSPFNASLYELADKLRSPGRAERLLWKVKGRAEAILSAYEGEIKPSWTAVAKALLVSQQVGKAAVIAVAATIRGRQQYFFRSYSQARAWLVDYHLCREADASDGVMAKRQAEPQLTKMGVEVFRIAAPRFAASGKQVGVDLEWLVRSANGRTYHHYRGWEQPRLAVQEALAAWRRQDKLASRQGVDLVVFLRGDEGLCPLLVREDSVQAGNCQSGTESWLRARGWADREFIPGAWLIPHLDYGLARNVAMQVYRQHTR